MKLKHFFIFMFASMFFVTVMAGSSYAVIKDYEKTQAAKDRAEQTKKKIEQNKGKPVPGFQTATPSQQQKAKEDMKKRLAEEQKKKDEQAKKAVVDMKQKELQQRGVDTKLKEYKAK